jgi:hypothetical protein
MRPELLVANQSPNEPSARSANASEVAIPQLPDGSLNVTMFDSVSGIQIRVLRGGLSQFQ